MANARVLLAHELWFVRDRAGDDWSFLVEPRTLLYLGAAVLVVGAARALARLRNGVDVPAVARLAPWMPFALRLHASVSLVGLLSGGAYLAPHLELPNSFTGWLLGVVVAVTAVSLVAGYRARVGAALLLASGPLGMLEFGAWPILQRIDLLGLALFLLLAGPGRWSADYELGRERDPAAKHLGQSIWALRVCVGLALIFVALAEKLADPQLALDFINSQDVQFNFLRTLGLPVTDLEFVRLAGAVEVLFGLLLISGALPQAVVLIAGLPFNLTLYFFGTIELLGHLPVYGAMLVLLVYGSDPQLRRLCSAPLPPLAPPRLTHRPETPARAGAGAK